MIAKVDYAYVIELRPTFAEIEDTQSYSGFDWPENKIKNATEEIFYGLKDYLVNFSKKVYPESVTADCNQILKQMKRLNGNNSGHRDFPENSIKFQ